MVQVFRVFDFFFEYELFFAQAFISLLCTVDHCCGSHFGGFRDRVVLLHSSGDETVLSFLLGGIGPEANPGNHGLHE